MCEPFDIALFLRGVLTGSKVTQKRHLRQARLMQAAILQRWQRDNPWTWQLKHVRWFITQHLKDHSEASRYYYRLTASLIWKRKRKKVSAAALGRRAIPSLRPPAPDQP
ncbi:hypothetical protein [Pseudomonas sp. zfem002]|uniref:hypothetical protein n=1 Tax=Pseudomonas sp. zfem002 TaxID=3078197 RepID=UPI00292A187E|nr:hypothetical protein [Pseudomonas sp. zfem002]MDU9391855.1 hypothetical protein [Pseudomonas sp. zfem002]